MILLPGYNLDCLIYLLSIFVIVISLKVGDLAGKLSFDNGYYDLSLVRNKPSYLLLRDTDLVDPLPRLCRPFPKGIAREVPLGSSSVRRFVGVVLRRQDSRVRALRPGGRGIECFPCTSPSAISLCGISRVLLPDRSR
jgi:hypothetical protein